MNTHNDTPLYCEMRFIKSQTAAYAEERISFKNGKRLGDIYIHDNKTCRKVRRILEKRVAQDYWKNARKSSGRSNRGRYETRHYLANQFQNLYGNPVSMLRACA